MEIVIGNCNGKLLACTLGMQKGVYLKEKILYEDKNNTIISSAISGDYIIFSMKVRNNCVYSDKNIGLNEIGIYNIKTKGCKIYKTKLCKNITSIVPVYPGRFYVSSGKTNALISFQFNLHTLEIESEKIHFELDEKPHNCYFSSVYNFNGRWFGSLYSIHNDTSGCVIELSNQRIIYSGLSKPCNVMFNKHERLCFTDFYKMVLIYGDSIFKFKTFPICFVESETGNLLISFSGLSENYLGYFSIEDQEITQKFHTNNQINTVLVLKNEHKKLIFE